MSNNQDNSIKLAADKVIEDKKAMGRRIECARLNLVLNQSELARLVGVTPQAVQQWERGGHHHEANILLK